MTIAQFALSIYLLVIPLQLGLHFWPDWTIVLGRKIDYLSPTLYFSDIVFVLVLAMFLKIKAFRLTQLFAIGFLMAPLLLINVYSSQWQITVFGWLRYVQVVIVGFIFAQNLIKMLGATRLLAFVVIVLGIVGFAQFFNQHSVGGVLYYGGEREFSVQTPGVAKASVLGREVLRPYGLFSHPNTMAGFLVAALPPLFWYALKAKSPLDYFLSRLGIVIAPIAVCLSFSRVAIVVMLFLFITALFQSRLHFVQKTVLVACLGLFLVIIEVTSGRFSQLSTNDVSIVERSWLLSRAVIMIKNSPLFGGGIGSFIPRVPLFEQPPFILQPVHNVWLLLLTEIGIVGCIYMFLLIRTFVKHILHSPFFWSIVVIAITGMFDHYWLTQPQTRLFMGAIFGLSISYSKASKSSKSV